MKIMVFGCGKIGVMLIKELAAEGHDVTAVDVDAAVVESVGNIYDVMGVCGGCTDCDTLREAGAAEADLCLAVTGSDERNMLACFLARRMGTKHTVARIRNPEYSPQNIAFMKQQLDLSLVINPERFVARELSNILKFPSATNIETFSTRNFEMIELRLREDNAMVGMSLSEVRHKFEGKFLVCMVRRGEDVVIPDGNFVLQPEDKIGLTAAPNELMKLLKKLGLMQHKARNVMIFGGSRTALFLAERLIAGGNTVKVIESNELRCKEISEAVPEAIVIHGDGTSQDLLLEEGLRSMDAFVSLTGMDEENILISIFAQNHQVPKVITKINRPEMASMAEKLGLDSVISPLKVTADVVSRFARALENGAGSNVETLYKVMDGKAEVLEFKVGEAFSHTGVPLKSLPTKKNTLVVGIVRGKEAIIPSGDDVILPGDRVIAVATGHRLKDLTDLLD